MIDQDDIPPNLAGGILCIDLKVLQDNWRKVAGEAAPAECGATVKGDAYGIGLEPVARALWQAGCRTFFTALPLEGAEVRKLLPEATVYVLCGVLAGQADFYSENSLIPVLATPEQVREWRACCRASNARLATALHLDTGINRLGLDEEQARALAADTATLEAFDLRLIISHLACGDDPLNPMNEAQRQKFATLRALFPPAPASLANSPGAFLGEAFTFDVVRPGIALYGGNPFAARANPMSAVVHLYAPLLQVRELAKGESVGYGATWTASRPSRIGVIGVGYRDGYPRALSSPATGGPACAFIGGHYAPVIGRISMDLITIDLTDVPEKHANPGQRVELMGDNITIDDIARWADTIPYEVITRLGSRYARIYSSLDS